MFVDEGPVQGNVSDETFFKIMKNKNPEMFSSMVEELNRMERNQVERVIKEDTPPPPEEPSFLNTRRETS